MNYLDYKTNCQFKICWSWLVQLWLDCLLNKRLGWSGPLGLMRTDHINCSVPKWNISTHLEGQKINLLREGQAGEGGGGKATWPWGPNMGVFLNEPSLIDVVCDMQKIYWTAAVTGTVVRISFAIRFVCIKLSQIFTVKHVLRYGEAKFVVKKKEILNKKLGLGQTPPPLLGLCPNFFCFFYSDSSPELSQHFGYPPHPPPPLYHEIYEWRNHKNTKLFGAKFGFKILYWKFLRFFGQNTSQGYVLELSKE